MRILGWPKAIGVFVFLLSVGVSSFMLPPARCRDGWQSTAIGHRGACSHHGGVDKGPIALGLLLSAAFGFGAWRIVSRLGEQDEQRKALADHLAWKASLRTAAMDTAHAEKSNHAGVKGYETLKILAEASDTQNDSVKCPICNGSMRAVLNHEGKWSGRIHWQCMRHPDCDGAIIPTSPISSIHRKPRSRKGRRAV